MAYHQHLFLTVNLLLPLTSMRDNSPIQKWQGTHYSRSMSFPLISPKQEALCYFGALTHSCLSGPIACLVQGLITISSLKAFSCLLQLPGFYFPTQLHLI